MFLATFLVALLSACSGLRGRADDLYAQGAYRAAIETYEAALLEEPRNEKALAGLKRARTTFIDKTLIEVRMARFAGNLRLALDLLLEIVTAEAKWAYAPVGAVATTQSEESQEALRYIEAQVMDAIRRERPLGGLYLLTHYQPIFSGELSGRHAFLVDDLTRRAGARQCRTLAKIQTAKYPYFSEFVRKVCTAWGMSDQGKASLLNAKRAELYRGVKVAANVDGLPAPYRSGIDAALENALESSPWFDPKGGRILTVVLDGKFQLEHQKNPEHRFHGYTEQVPYTDYEEVTKTRQVPVVVNDVTTYQTEFYSEREPVTRYHHVPRSQPYDGVYHRQSLEFRAGGTLTLNKISKPLRIDGSTHREGFEHHWNMPAIGLHSERPHLEDPETWVRQQAERLGSDMSVSANDIWDSLYCESVSGEPTLIATGDQVHRCLRSRLKLPPAFVEAWYSRFMGLSAREADRLLHFSDL